MAWPPSGRRRRALAVLLVAAVVAVAPAIAATNTAVGSIHTTDSDFQAADTLANVSVSGSGTGASVRFDPAVQDSFENQPADMGPPENWEEPQTADKVNVTGVRATAGSQSMYLQDFGSSIGSVRPAAQPYANGIDGNVSVSIWANFTGSSFANHVSVRLFGSGGRMIIVGMRNGDLQYFNGSWTTIATAPDEGEWVDVTLFQIDPSADTLAVEWSAPGGSGTETGIQFENPTSGGYERSELSVFDADGFFDDFKIEEGEGVASGTYTSSSHTVDNAVQGFTDLTLTNTQATVTWEGSDDGGQTWTQVGQNTFTSGGNKTISFSNTFDEYRVTVEYTPQAGASLATLEDEGVEFTNHDPRVDNSTASPSGGAELSTNNPSLEIQVNDTEFGTAQGDTVTIEWFVDGKLNATTTVNANGTASQQVSVTNGGSHTWHVEVADDYGGSNQSDTFSFKVPDTLTVREETAPHDKITGVTAQFKFFEDVEDDPTIVNRSSSNGEIDLSGLPTGTEFSVSVKAPGFHNRTVILQDLFDQQTVFLLNKSRTSVENNFVVDDSTGDFPASNTEIIIEKAINRSLYGGSPSGFSWTTVGGDDLGADKGFVIDLEEGDRYRIKVQNEQGDTRVLGAYVPETAGTVTLEIGQVVIDPTGDTTPTYSANRTNESGQPVRVNFEYNDSTENTTTLWLEIYEYQNQSNVLLSNTSFDGPFGTFTHTEDVPSADNQTTWVVKFTAVRSPEANIQGTIIVGPQREVLSDLPAWLRALLSLGTIWIIAGLFSKVNGDIGAVVIAGFGAMFWYVGFVPGGLGTGVVVLSLITAGLIFVNERRTTGL